jgi:iron-sulfur cluster assembly accessory protein
MAKNKMMVKKNRAKKTASNKAVKPKTATKKQRITKGMLIGEVIMRYPSLIPVLLSEGIHCVGCGAAYAETIGQGLASHGKSKKEVEALIKKLNDSIPRTFGNATLHVTEPAIGKLCQFLKDGQGLRIDVVPGGSEGFFYRFDIEKTKKKDDTVIPIQTIKFYIDKKSLAPLKGATIDFIDTTNGAGFRIINPNIKKMSGCERSCH